MNRQVLVERFLHENEFDDLKDWCGFYKINKKGEIWSCWYNKIMKPQVEQGYYFITLRKTIDSKKIQHKGRIHRLLAIQYIPNPDNLTDVDHIDRNRQNNNLDNLRWYSHRQNANNIKKGNGCVYLDKSTTERTGKPFWKAQHSLTIDGFRKTYQKSSHDKQVVEDWLSAMLEEDK